MTIYWWLIRREFWENRAIWMVPLGIGIAQTLAALFGRVEVLGVSPGAAPRMMGGMLLIAFGATFFVVMSIYSTWYLLDCLYSDRKDRSILFWKSLPISDTATVLAKLFTALIVIPLVYFVAADVTSLLMAFIISVRARAAFGGSLWQADLWLSLQALWLYAIVTLAIWYLPVSAWLLLVSAWAKRAVTLWSILPPLALYFAERWFLGTAVLASQLQQRLMGYPALAFHGRLYSGPWMSAGLGNQALGAPANVWNSFNPGAFISSPATWIGVAVGVLLICGAIQLRLRRTEI